MGGRVKGCPGCGNLVEKVGGDHHVMCGCEAKPAGGALAEALAGGGCSHEWSWKDGRPLGGGRPGHPINDAGLLLSRGISEFTGVTNN